jgi:hypothetical protein
MPGAATYREPDPQRTADDEAARLADEEAIARQVRAMKSTAVALRGLMPVGLARTAIVLAALAVCVPIACVAVGGLAGFPHGLRSVLAWVALASGILGGWSAFGVGVAALVTQETSRFPSVAATMVGVVAMPMSLVCGVAAAGPW